MQRPHRRAALSVALALLLIAAPANAGPPERVEVTNHISVLASFEDHVVIFWNITGVAFCDWLLPAPAGPPPAILPVSWQFKETGQGATVASAQGEAPVELWRFEGPLPANPVEFCDNLVEGDAPWATGTARLQFNDNDRFGSGTRTNSYGAHAQGQVRDAAGTRWHVSWNWRGIIEPSGEEYRMWSEHFTIRPIGG
jgi:hypothetical protein